MKVGAEPKKIAVLGGLALVLAYVFYSSVLSSSSEVRARPQPAPAASRPDPTDTVVRPPAPETRPRPPLRGRTAGSQQVRFTFADSKVDPTTVDPTLRLDLLAKVQAVTLEGGERNLFQYGAAPAPKVPEPKIVPKSVSMPEVTAGLPDTKPIEPPKPPPPPIPLEFYGYSSQAKHGVKRAFFLNGDEIVVAGEGDLIKNRYKVIRIGINSAEVEDTQFSHKQTLPLKEQTG